MTKPMTTITNDWETHTWTIQVASHSPWTILLAVPPQITEYQVKCYVYLTLKEVPDSYHWPARDTQVADYSLEGFETLPPYPGSHEKEIERQLLVLLEELYGQA